MNKNKSKPAFCVKDKNRYKRKFWVVMIQEERDMVPVLYVGAYIY